METLPAGQHCPSLYYPSNFFAGTLDCQFEETWADLLVPPQDHHDWDFLQPEALEMATMHLEQWSHPMLGDSMMQLGIVQQHLHSGQKIFQNFQKGEEVV
jgi:hypothetical protein